MIRSVARAALQGCVVALLLGLAVGCSEDDAHPWDLVPALQTPSAPDIVIHNLQIVYNRLLVTDYDKLLDGDFVFYFEPVDMDHVDQAVRWDRSAEMASATKLFTGQPGTTPGGQPRPPVTQIALSLTPSSSAWSDVVPAAFAGTFHRVYDVGMTASFHDGATQSVHGIQDFYVAAVQVEGQTQYRLRYWVDLCTPEISLLGGVDADPVNAVNVNEPICWSAFKSGDF